MLRGKTPGSVANESTVIGSGIIGSVSLNLENGKGYALRYTATCGAVIGGVRSTRRLEYVLSVRADAGTAVIDGVSALINSVGSAATASFAIAFSVSGANIVATFSTGAGVTAATAIACRLDFVEVVYP